jgi:hypothetical protein
MTAKPDVLDMPWGCANCGHKFGIVDVKIECIDGKPIGAMLCPRCLSKNMGVREPPSLKLVPLAPGQREKP